MPKNPIEYNIPVKENMNTDALEVIASLNSEHIWTIVEFIEKRWDGVTPLLGDAPAWATAGFAEFKSYPAAKRKSITDMLYDNPTFEGRDEVLEYLENELDAWWKRASPLSLALYGPPLPPSPPRRRAPAKRPRAQLEAVRQTPRGQPRAQPRAQPAVAQNFGDIARAYFADMEERMKRLEEKNASLEAEVIELRASIGKSVFKNLKILCFNIIFCQENEWIHLKKKLRIGRRRRLDCSTMFRSKWKINPKAQARVQVKKLSSHMSTKVLINCNKDWQEISCVCVN